MFDSEQTYELLVELGYQGPKREDTMRAFLKSNPKAAATLGRLSEAAVKMAEGGMVGRMPAVDKQIEEMTEQERLAAELNRRPQDPMGGLSEQEYQLNMDMQAAQQRYVDQFGAPQSEQDAAKMNTWMQSQPEFFAMQNYAASLQGTTPGTGVPVGPEVPPESARTIVPNGLEISQAYQEVFGRAPDQEGLLHWQSKMDSGMSLEELTTALKESPESTVWGPQSQYFPGSEWTNEANDYFKSSLGSGMTPAETMASYQAQGSISQGDASQNLETIRSELAHVQTQATQIAAQLAEDPENEALKALSEQLNQQLQDKQKELGLAQANASVTTPSGQDVFNKAISDPGSMVTSPEVQAIPDNPDMYIPEGTGQITGEVPQVGAPSAVTPDQVQGVTPTEAPQVTAQTSSDQVGDLADNLNAPEGSVGVTVDPITGNPLDSARFQLDQPEAAVAGQADLAGLGSISREGTGVSGPTGFTAPTIEVGQIGDAPQIEAAKASYTPQAEAVTQETAPQATSAKFQGTPPKASQVNYVLGSLEVGSREVQQNEIAVAQGLGLTAEQSQTYTSQWTSTLEAAKGTLGAGELVGPNDFYNLPPTQIANMGVANIKAAQTISQFPSAEAAQSSWNSVVQAAQGSVGANELASVQDIMGAAQAVNAVAATMSALDANAVAAAEQGSLSQASLAQAEQMQVSPQSTVQGQMANLMSQFEDGTPAWAAGAIRAANAAMATRGMGASSMAGAAITQAAMESAIPIAAQDAKFFFDNQMANTDRRQQTALANAAAQAGMELQNLQGRQAVALQNSSNAFALQSQNLSNMQQTVLANAQFKAALQEQSINVRTQVGLANAAKYAEKNNINLNNRQQSLLTQASQNLEIELTNLSNSQSTALANLQVTAALTGQNLDNEQQMAVLESQRNMDIAQFEATAKQQAFLQDAASRMALEGKSMDARLSTSLFNAARVAELNNINLSNEQQIRLQRSAENLQVDLANTSNRQQTALANAQLRAALQGQVLSNQQQTEILNAEKYAEANNLTYSSKTQAVMQEFITRATLEGQAMTENSRINMFNVANIVEERGLQFNADQQTALANMNSKLQIDVQNLSNRQSTALANAQIAAAIVGQELTAEQQTRTVNAQMIAEMAGIQFNAEVQAAVTQAQISGNLQEALMNNQTQASIASANNATRLAETEYQAKVQMSLENARLTNTINIANLDSQTARYIQDAAAISNMDLANLDNRQRAQVENAKNFLSMDLANLDAETQTQIVGFNAMVNSLLSDTAALNAAAQFNASSQQQSDLFFAGMQERINTINTELKFRADSENADRTLMADQFNATQQSLRDQFNAGNALVVSQANTKWRQDMATLDTAAINEANFETARISNGLTVAAIDQLWQQERDIMSFAYQQSESLADRNLSLLLADKQIDAAEDQANSEALGYIAGKILFGSGGSGLLEGLF